MNQELITKLERGIYLEKAEEFINWNIPFEDLKNLGDPITRQSSARREDFVWKNEKFLDGLKGDLTIMRWLGLQGMNKYVKHAFTSINQAEFQYTVDKLNTDFGNSAILTYDKVGPEKYKWSLTNCRIEFSRGVKLSDNCILNIYHKEPESDQERPKIFKPFKDL